MKRFPCQPQHWSDWKTALPNHHITWCWVVVARYRVQNLWLRCCWPLVLVLRQGLHCSWSSGWGQTEDATAADNAGPGLIWVMCNRMKADALRLKFKVIICGVRVALILVTSVALSGHCCGVLSPYFPAIVCQRLNFLWRWNGLMLMGNVWPCFKSSNVPFLVPDLRWTMSSACNLRATGAMWNHIHYGQVKEIRQWSCAWLKWPCVMWKLLVVVITWLYSSP